MRFDRAELQEAEMEYLADRSDAVLERYYNLLMDAAQVLLLSYARRIGFRVPPDRISELCHDAVTRFLERFWKHPNPTAVPVAERMFHEVQYQLANPKRRRYEQRVGSLEDLDLFGADDPEPVASLDEGNYLTEIAQDPTVQGRRIVFTLFDCRFYRTAVKRIAEYTPKEWIYRNAVKLHMIFKMTRRTR